MLFLSKSKIIYSSLIIIMIVFVYGLSYKLLSRRNIGEAVAVVTLPVSNKTIVLDARSWLSLTKEQRVQMVLQKQA